MIEEGYIELFEHYQNNDLSADDRKAFEARLVYDQEFNEAYEKYLKIEKGISEHYRAELKSKLKDFDAQLNSKKSINYKKWSLLVAAVFILGIILTRLFTTNNYEEVVRNNWSEEIGLPVKMSSKGKYDEAMNAYKLKNWQSAIKYLSVIKTDTSNYYLGLVYYEVADYQKAISIFEDFPQTSAYNYQVKFRLGLLYLMSGKPLDIKKAKNTFQSLSNQSFYPEIATSAQIILKEMK